MERLRVRERMEEIEEEGVRDVGMRMGRERRGLGVMMWFYD